MDNSIESVAVVGSDGYTGWALVCHLLSRGYDVYGVDNLSRRRRAKPSVTPIRPHRERSFTVDRMDHYEGSYHWVEADLTEWETVEGIVEHRPDAIVNLAQIPSAPFSMQTFHDAWQTKQNNLRGTLNLLWGLHALDHDAHVVQLATMGEYPIGKNIPEGFLDDGRPAPKDPGSLYHACYDDETEILTESRGWVPFADLTGEEKVATRSAESREVVFKKPDSVHEYDFDGELYLQQNTRLDFCVTPNHRIFTQKHSGHDYKELRQEWPDDVDGEQRVYDVGLEWSGDSPDTIDVDGVGEIPTDDWMAFMGWFIAEGSVPERADRPANYRTEVRQKGDSDGIVAIESCMETVAEAAGRELVVYEDGGTDGGQAVVPMHRYVIPGKELAAYMGQFGKAREKHIPHRLKQLGTPHLEVLLHTLIEGDGWHHNPEWGRENYRYATVSEQLADDVQEIALKCGFAANVRWDEKKGIYVVNICQTPRVHVNHGDSTDQWIGYEGKVYCCTVDGGVILVRRNGKPVWCGNSKVQATVDTLFASRTWDLPVTEIYQGIVYGLPDIEDDRLLTRFDVDAVWGTVLNRFTAQAAVDEPLTVYGRGGQKRAMLPIDDCVRCIRLAIENPPGPDTPGRHPYRAINQFQGSHRVRDLAEMVQDHTDAEIEHIPNPRAEDDSDHFYDPEREVLDELGYEPSASIEDVFKRTHAEIEEYAGRVPVSQLQPDVTWDHTDSG